MLTRKQVKYINLRIKSNGEIAVSAHRRVPATYVDKFVESKAPFILEALERVEKRREEIRELEQRRGENRRARRKSGVPVVALVG